MPPTVTVCQLALRDLDVEHNHELVREAVAAEAPASDLLVCPELALTGFVPDERIHDAALSADGPTLADLQSAADRTDTGLVVGFVEAADGAYYNATAYLSPDGERTVYRKRHLWGDERRVLAPGDRRVTVETPVGEAGLLTCYDLNFVAESGAHAREHVRALVVVGAWPAAYSENWRLLCRARALDGARWVVAAGRTGRRDVPEAAPVTYAGRSMVARPDGGVHAATGRRERSLTATLDPAVLSAQREVVGIFGD